MHTKASPSHHPVWDCMAGTSVMFAPWTKSSSLGQASSMSSSDGGTCRAHSNSLWYRTALHSLVGSGPKSHSILWQENVVMYFPFHCDPLLFVSHLTLSFFVKRVPAVCLKPANPAPYFRAVARIPQSGWVLATLPLCESCMTHVRSHSRTRPLSEVSFSHRPAKSPQYSDHRAA